jgi:serine/threonine-protein kinase RsbT
MVRDEVRIHIGSETDIVAARQCARALAEEIGFTGSDLTVIATAISEVARNIVQYADSGEIILRRAIRDSRVGIIMIAQDNGPGIVDVGKAMQDGFSTGIGLGLGLPGARRLVDEFDIESRPGAGTTVSMIKWADNHVPKRWPSRR